ncbi:hypothetical protein WJX74_005433 [Apatococcus lobatus]|uniref:Beta-fructofuranosidase n=1 Tax=Apatococcus lobatus TaxID=904363 RepID=A0AAW1RJN9_9CHLO
MKASWGRGLEDPRGCLARAVTSIILLASLQCGQAHIKPLLHDHQGRVLSELPSPSDQTGKVLDFTVHQAQAQRPLFHITPDFGWSNDPNGMLQYNGVHHVFFQHTPNETVFGRQTWAHVASTDLVHWKRLPTALYPDRSYDTSGVFSGSATLYNGIPYQLYTGVSQFQELGYYFQVQAVALPANLSDPMLVDWVKPADNPIIPAPPDGATNQQFRDPTTAFYQDGAWRVAVGTQLNCSGTALLYSTQDFQSYTYNGVLASQIGIEPNGLCADSGLGSTEKCNQIGEGCRMWECVDAVHVGPVMAIKWSDQVNGRSFFSRDWYVLSSATAQVTSLDLDGPEGSFQPGVDGTAFYSPQAVDYGLVYASKFWRDAAQRQLWMGWTFETSAGCDQACSTGTNFTTAQGYQGAQTLARLVTYDPEIQELVFYPTEESKLLRSQQQVSRLNSLPVNEEGASVLGPNVSRNQHMYDADVSFALQGDSGAVQPFSVGLVLVMGVNSDTDVTFQLNGTATTSSSGMTNVTSLGVYVDRRNAPPPTNTTYGSGFDGGPVTLPEGGTPGTNLRLRALIDNSLFEVFAQDGRGRVTSRAYSLAVDEAWDLKAYGSFAGSVKVSGSVWAMDACWVDDLMIESQ